MFFLYFRDLFLTYFSQYTQNTKAATAIEYCLMAAAIAVAIIVIVYSLGDGVESTFTDVDAEMTANF